MASGGSNGGAGVNVVKVAIVILAVIGLFSIAGWIFSTLFWLARVVLLVAVVVLVVVVVRAWSRR
jgi:hypothetical protein